MSIISLVCYPSALYEDVFVNKDSFLRTLPFKSGPLCSHAMHSCIAIEVLPSILFFESTNLSHSTDMSAWLPCFMSICILFRTFTVRLGPAFFFSRKKKKPSCVSWCLPSFACQGLPRANPYSYYLTSEVHSCLGLYL
jgi:hypothetical protein